MRFSVIVPLYNKASYVKKALQSVLDQTFNDWELIVIDDGSKDDSFEVAEKYLKENGNDRCHLIHQENAGVSTARNNGVAASHGDYVCFLDADDWWSSGFLEEMDGLISKYPDAGIYGTSYYIVKNGKNRVAPIAFDDGFEKGYVDYVKTYSKFLCMPLWTGAVCIIRSIYDEMHGFKPQLKLGEDFDFWLRIALKHKVAMVNKPLAYYNQDVDSLNRGVRKKYNSTDSFMTFWFNQFSEYEKENHYLKQLLDRIRVTSLLCFRRYNVFKEETYNEINKVDFNNVSRKYRLYYKLPYPMSWCLFVIREIGSKIKKSIT